MEKFKAVFFNELTRGEDEKVQREAKLGAVEALIAVLNEGLAKAKTEGKEQLGPDFAADQEMFTEAFRTLTM